MTPTQKKRFTVVASILAGTGTATFFILMAIKSNLEYFRTPTQIYNGEFNTKQIFKVAGLVKKGSVTRLTNGITQRFTITDCEHDVSIEYTGILPDLFREGQAIVTIGAFNGAFNSAPTLIANKVLAKHDENYVPNEAADAMMLAQANKCDMTDGPASY